MSTSYFTLHLFNPAFMVTPAVFHFHHRKTSGEEEGTKRDGSSIAICLGGSYHQLIGSFKKRLEISWFVHSPKAMKGRFKKVKSIHLYIDRCFTREKEWIYLPSLCHDNSKKKKQSLRKSLSHRKKNWSKSEANLHHPNQTYSSSILHATPPLYHEICRTALDEAVGNDSSQAP